MAKSRVKSCRPSGLPLLENLVCKIEPDVKWLKRLLDHREVVNYSYKCQLTWTHGLYRMVHFVIKVYITTGCWKKQINLISFSSSLLRIKRGPRSFLAMPFLYKPLLFLAFSFNYQSSAWEVMENTLFSTSLDVWSLGMIVVQMPQSSIFLVPWKWYSLQLIVSAWRRGGIQFCQNQSDFSCNMHFLCHIRRNTNLSFPLSFKKLPCRRNALRTSIVLS